MKRGRRCEYQSNVPCVGCLERPRAGVGGWCDQPRYLDADDQLVLQIGQLVAKTVPKSCGVSVDVSSVSRRSLAYFM